MYTSSSKFSSIVNFFDGFMIALILEKKLPAYIWIKWINCKFNIWSTNWGWDRIILHAYKTEEKAIEHLPEIFTEYLDEINEIGEEGILVKHNHQFKSGERVPHFTDTKLNLELEKGD